MSASSVTVRAELCEALRLDLVGPDNDHAFANELLPEAPSRWYLTGFLVPRYAPEDQRVDAQADEELDADGDADGDDASPPERTAARKSYIPSSLGLSVLAAPGVKTLNARVVWGDYEFQGKPSKQDESAPAKEEATDGDSSAPARRGYRRVPHDEAVSIDLSGAGDKPIEINVPASRGVTVVVTCRAVTASASLPAGTRSVAVFLVNNRKPDPDHGYRAFAFQAGLILASPQPFVARPDPRGESASTQTDEWDEQVADLQYRDVFEFAVGHGVAATATLQRDRSCKQVQTVWIPSAEVERVEPARIGEVTLDM